MKKSADAEKKMNLATVQRVDPYITDLVTSAKHVALYNFGNDQKWEKTDTEGTFFVYKREGDPQYGFLVLNRLSANNLVEPVTKEMDFQLKPPFLLYKTKDDDIFGIWFHETEECKMVAKTMSELVAKTEERMKLKEMEKTSKGKSNNLAGLLANAGGSKVENSAPNSEENKLMNLLNSAASGSVSDTKARKSSLDSPPIMTTAINGSGSTTTNTNNVAQFFAQAASGSGNVASALPRHPIPVIPHGPIMLPPSMAMNFAAAAAGGHRQPVLHHIPPQIPMAPPNDNSGNPVMARLMSNPGVHSLEILERQQRMESASPLSHHSANSPVNNSNALPPLPATAKSANEIETQLQTKMNLDKPSESYATKLNSMEKCKSRSGATTESVIAQEQSSGLTLLSPMVFSQTKPKMANKQFDLNGSESKIEITPLTESQLHQAFQHLLQTDSTFITKLHQAYIESLNTKLN